MEMYELHSMLHWSLFIKYELTIFQHWSWWLGADQGPGITWTNCGLFADAYMRQSASMN